MREIARNQSIKHKNVGQIIKNLPDFAVEIKDLFFGKKFKSILILTYHKKINLAIENNFNEFYCFGQSPLGLDDLIKYIFSRGEYRVILLGKITLRQAKLIAKKSHLKMTPEVLMKFNHKKKLYDFSPLGYNLAKPRNLTKLINLQRLYIKEEIFWKPYRRLTKKEMQRIAEHDIKEKKIFINRQVTTKVEVGAMYDQTAKINRVFTLLNQRRRGYASACLQTTILSMLKNGQFKIFLNTRDNSTAKNIYKKAGFSPVGLIYYFKKI